EKRCDSNCERREDPYRKLSN
ncbi:Hydroxyacylglutathione hydrolase, partial [Haemophilus influenzae]